MSAAVVRSAVAAAHARGATVIAHASEDVGAGIAVEAGVDVLAHTFPAERSGPWDRSLPAKMHAASVALIPTLSLWPWELHRAGLDSAVAATMAVARDQVRACLEAGVSIVFGTDVGYMTEYDPRAEYRELTAAGLEFADILTALTTAPAAAFGVSDVTGRIEPGFDADLVVLDRDPARSIDALASVRLVMRRGQVIFSAP
jgi:imidazolonepropionase-like amidohydrolase